MASPFQRAAQVAAKSSGTLRAQKIADLKKAMDDIDAAAASLPEWSPPPLAVPDPPLEFDVKQADGPQQSAPKKPKKKKPKPADKEGSMLSAGLVEVLKKAEKEGDLIWTEQGWKDADFIDMDFDNHPPLTAKQLQSKLYELQDAYSTLDAMEAESAAMPLDAKPQWSAADPFADIDPNAVTADADALPDLPEEWWKTPDMQAAIQKNIASATEGRPAILQQYKDADRRAGESVRDYVLRLRGMKGNPKNMRAVTSAVRDLEAKLAGHLQAGRVGKLERFPVRGGNDATRDYLDYLAANGVDQRTIDAIASGELPMNPGARAERATAMGLDPKAIWHRWDYPLKSEMRGWTAAALSQPEFQRSKRGAMSFIELSPRKEGLVYTSHSPDAALAGVQVPSGETVMYPLIGPSAGIAGLDRMPDSAYEAFKKKQAEALLKKYPPEGDVTQVAANAMLRRDRQRSDHLAETIVDPRNLEPYHDQRTYGMQELQGITPDSSTKQYATVPYFRTAEDRKLYTEPLMASGAKGTLVRDETGISTAFTPAGARELRRADLAPLDPRFKASRNILQSLLAPVAAGAGASQQGER